MCSDDTRTLWALIISSLLFIFGFLFSLSSATYEKHKFNFTGLVLIFIAVMICVYIELRKEFKNKEQERRLAHIQQINQQIQQQLGQLSLEQSSEQSEQSSSEKSTPLKYHTEIEEKDLENPDGLGQCSICLEKIEQQECFNFPCQHRYHIECISKWYESQKNTSCPLCRENYP